MLAVNFDLDRYLEIKDKESKTRACEFRRGLEKVSAYISYIP